MIKILYVHGLGGGANSDTAKCIRENLGQGFIVDSPEIPFDPNEAIAFIRDIQDNYDILIGSSLGGFYVMNAFCGVNKKRILINPAIHAGQYILNNIGLGEFEYHRHRQNGDKIFKITNNFISELNKYDNHYFSLSLDEEQRYEITCCVSKNDSLLGCENYDNCIKAFFKPNVVEMYCDHEVDEESIKQYVIPQIFAEKEF